MNPEAEASAAAAAAAKEAEGLCFDTLRSCIRCRLENGWYNVGIQGRTRFFEFPPGERQVYTIYACEKGIHRYTIKGLLVCPAYSISRRIFFSSSSSSSSSSASP